MNMNQPKFNVSIAQHADPGKVDPFPYPQIVIENALPESSFRELLNAYPPISLVSSGHDNLKNYRFDLHPNQVLENENIDRI
jgi:hypothetical protein